MLDEDLSLIDLDESYSTSFDPVELPEEEAVKPDPEEMLVLLHSDAVLERMQAARAFCELEDPRAVSRLIELLKDDCPLVRVSAAYALGRNPSPDALLPLIDQLSQDWNGYVRKGVVWALGNCRDCQALHPLISALCYDIAAVRLWAASALGQLGDMRAIAPLTTALRADKMEVVRGNCAWALGKLLSRIPHRSQDDDEYVEALDALIEAAEDEDLGVQQDAKVALRVLGDPRGIKVLDRIDMEQGYCELLF